MKEKIWKASDELYCEETFWYIQYVAMQMITESIERNPFYMQNIVHSNWTTFVTGVLKWYVCVGAMVDEKKFLIKKFHKEYDKNDFAQAVLCI